MTVLMALVASRELMKDKRLGFFTFLVFPSITLYVKYFMCFFLGSRLQVLLLPRATTEGSSNPTPCCFGHCLVAADKIWKGSKAQS